jgi:hypothetical protein
MEKVFLSPEDRANKEKGKAIVKAFYSQQTSNATNLNFFLGRSQRMQQLLLWSKGSQPMEQFLDFMSVSDANKAHVPMDMTQQRIAAQFVGTLVESMAKNKLYPCVNAIDDGSLSEKEDRMLEALFRMRDIETIQDLQQQAGVQLEPTGAYVPDDELMARVYFELEDRLPKEIRFEEMLGLTLDSILFENVLNRKTLYDHTVVNLGATKIERIAPKKYSIRKGVPTNMIYNFFMNDTGDCELTMVGEFYNLKVRELRAKFGKTDDRPDGLTELDIFELAKNSATKQNIGTFNYQWQQSYSMLMQNTVRPYDDCSILVLDCEILCGEETYYVAKTDSFGRENISLKKNVPYQTKNKEGKIIEQPKPDNVKIIKKQSNPWMRGVYAPYGDKMLYWGEPDLIVSEFTNVSKPMSSWTISIPNNDGDYVPSLFERIMEPLREYTMLKLKRKQLISQIRPAGIRIDVESARNIDLGNGNSIGWEEVLRIFNQTGTEVWSSKGLDPLSKEAPAISNTAHDDTVSKIIEITNVLASIVQEIRQLIGVPQYRDGSDVGDRTSGVLQEQQNNASYNVSDYVLNANNTLWEQTCYKLCLLHWNDIVKEEPESKDDMINTRFKVQVKMKSTDYERERLEADIQRYSQVPDEMGQPSLTLKDAMMIREIDDPKLARWYLTKTYEENRRKANEEASRRTRENAETQNTSLQQKAENDAKLAAAEMDAKKEMAEFESTKKKEEILLQGYLAVAAKDESGKLIAAFMPAIQQLVPNITIPLAAENKQMDQAAVAQEQQEELAEQQAGQPQESPMGEQQEMQQQPEMQMQ